MGIKEWLRRHQIEPDPSQYDERLEDDREQARKARIDALVEIEQVRQIRRESGTVHRGMEQLREDNHFSPWLFGMLKEGPR